MSNTITGKEVATTTFDSDGKVVEWGETIYGKTLREFMRELIHHKLPMEDHKPEMCAELAHSYTLAYLKKLNEQQ